VEARHKDVREEVQNGTSAREKELGLIERVKGREACVGVCHFVCVCRAEQADGEDPPVEKGEYAEQIPARAQGFWRRTIVSGCPRCHCGSSVRLSINSATISCVPMVLPPFFEFRTGVALSAPEPPPGLGFSDHTSPGHWTLRCKGTISHTSYFSLFFYFHSYLSCETLQLFGFPTGPQDAHDPKKCCFAPMFMTSPMMDSVFCSIPTSRIFRVALPVPDPRIVMPAYTKIFVPRIVLCHRITAISSVFFNAKEFRSAPVPLSRKFVLDFEHSRNCESDTTNKIMTANFTILQTLRKLYADGIEISGIKMCIGNVCDGRAKPTVLHEFLEIGSESG
jgi:hypothetical protein